VLRRRLNRHPSARRGNRSWRRAQTGRAFSKPARCPARSRSIPRPRRPSGSPSTYSIARRATAFIASSTGGSGVGCDVVVDAPILYQTDVGGGTLGRAPVGAVGRQHRCRRTGRGLPPPGDMQSGRSGDRVADVAITLSDWDRADTPVAAVVRQGLAHCQCAAIGGFSQSSRIKQPSGLTMVSTRSPHRAASSPGACYLRCGRLGRNGARSNPHPHRRGQEPRQGPRAADGPSPGAHTGTAERGRPTPRQGAPLTNWPAATTSAYEHSPRDTCRMRER
jgi:hypothetical protein